jgi:DNA (cytosine-5)-methyltransferase 1
MDICSMKNKIKVVELFAGVGGFRLGLEGWNNKSVSHVTIG